VSATLEKALVLIEAMAQARQPSGVTQLSRALNLNKSTVYRLLDILCQHGYARQDEVARSYVLTTKLWELGVSVLRNISVHSVAPAFMEACANETGETLLLTIPDGDQSLVIAKADSPQPLQIFSAIGSRLPLHCSSVGKALMIDWPEDRIRRYAPHKRTRQTENSIASAEDLIAEIEAARAQGYARSMDEWLVGISGVAAPIRDTSGEIVATIGITGPTSRLHPAGFEPLGRKAVEVAAQISRVLGYLPVMPDTVSAAVPDGGRQASTIG